MFQLLLAPDTPRLAPAIAAHACSALEAMRLAALQAKRAIDAFAVAEIDADEESNNPERWQIVSLRSTALTNAAIVQELATGVPTVPDRVFRSIARFANRAPWATPFLESAVLASTLACGALGAAVELLDDEEAATSHLLRAALASMQGATSLVECDLTCFAGPLTKSELLDEMIAGRPIPTVAEWRHAMLDGLVQELALADAVTASWPTKGIRRRVDLLRASIHQA